MHAIDMLCPINWLDPLNRGLVARYQCLPGITGGRRFVDLTSPGPMGRHGTLTAMDPVTAWKGTSRPGGFGALAPDGTDDYVQVADSDVFDFLTETYTFALWVFRTDNDTAYILSKGPNNNGWGVYLEGTSTASVNVVHNNQSDASFSAVIPNNTWTHLVVTANGATIFCFRNGIQISSDGVNQAVSANTTDMVIAGSLNVTTPQFLFGGQLDEVCIYNRAFSASEVKDLYLDSRAYSPRTLRRIGRDETYTQEELEIIEFRRRGILLGGRMNHDRGILTGGRL